MRLLATLIFLINLLNSLELTLPLILPVNLIKDIIDLLFVLFPLLLNLQLPLLLKVSPLAFGLTNLQPYVHNIEHVEAHHEIEQP